MTMQTFTGYEYTLIDIANNFHEELDKLTFEKRLDWAYENLDHLEELAEHHSWKEKPQFLKAVQALRDIQSGNPVGHLIGFDAVCSGLQLMSAMTGCHEGARATGLIDPDVRSDAYQICTDHMEEFLGNQVVIDRKNAKQAVMTSFYGSKAEPKKVFGEDTPELAAFEKAMYKLSPGSFKLLQSLLASWQPYTLAHQWQLPDGFIARIKTLQKYGARIEVDEAAHHTFEYIYSVNEGCEYDRKNAANVVHSVDAYVLRSLVRRCNYDREHALAVNNAIEEELLERNLHGAKGTMPDLVKKRPEIGYYVELYIRTGIADIVMLPLMDNEVIEAMDSEHLKGIRRILRDMLQHEPFAFVPVHDDFRCHPNNMNHLRWHYKEILATLADSQILGDILSQIYGTSGNYQKESEDLGDLIRNSNYALS